MDKLGLTPETMASSSMTETSPVVVEALVKWWPYVRKGGLYIIEDIATGGNPTGQHYGGRGPFFPRGFSPLTHNTSFLLRRRSKSSVRTTHSWSTLSSGIVPLRPSGSLGVWMHDNVDWLSPARPSQAARTAHEIHSNLASKLAMCTA